ncbi:MAG: DUF418 domain-containing protein [Planctomycetes bacterium]|nr:DUF418 domain-containing protein [Planctomycetota bacterium]
MTDAAPIPPAERIAAIDTVRGLAVLGILVMNIVEFGLPMRAYGNPTAAGGHDGADLWTWLVQEALFDGRMRALFSLLFGAGMVLLSDRLRATGRGALAADLLLRRCLWLIPFGIVHRFVLQWTGDILYIYGLLGVLAVGLRDLRPRTHVIAGLLALAAFVPIEYRKYAAAAEQRAQAATAATLGAEAQPLPAAVEAGAARWERRLKAAPADANDEELGAIRGSWLDVARFRWDHNHSFQSVYVYQYFFWDVIGMLLLGMGLARLGYFTAASPTWVHVAAIAGGAVATTVSFLLANAWAATDWSRGAIELLFYKDASYAFCRLLGGLGWASALILMVRAGALRWLTGALAAVGRMAFSNYVLQTLLCTALFFGWGLGWYGTLSRSQTMWCVLAVSLVQVAFSVLWQRRFRCGPLEWCWRSLTYWRRQPLVG